MSTDREVVQRALDAAADATRGARDAAWEERSQTGRSVQELHEALDAMRDHRAALERDGLPVSQHHGEVVGQLAEAIIEVDEAGGTFARAHMHCAAAAWLWARWSRPSLTTNNEQRMTDLERALAGEKNLSRANLCGAVLCGADLTGANLRGANLYGADLRDANLTGADLKGALLYGADLSGADLYGALLYGADLKGAFLHDADLSGADLYGANLHGANLHDAKHDAMTRWPKGFTPPACTP